MAINPVVGQMGVSESLRAKSAIWWAELLDKLGINGTATVMFSESIILRVDLTDSGFQWTQVETILNRKANNDGGAK